MTIELGKPIHFQGSVWVPIAHREDEVVLLNPHDQDKVRVPLSLLAEEPVGLDRLERVNIRYQDSLPRLDPRNYPLHLREIQTGQRLDGSWPPRPEYDPSVPMWKREVTKTEELRALGIHKSVRVLQRDRAHWLRHGEAFLIDGRSTEPHDPTPNLRPALAKAIKLEIDAAATSSKKTWPVRWENARYRLHEIEGGETGWFPRLTTFRKYWNFLDLGMKPFSTPSQRRQRAHTPRRVNKVRWSPLLPGAHAEIDTSRFDVLALDDDGEVCTVQLAIVVDVATRRIPATCIRIKAIRGSDLSDLLIRSCIPPEIRPLNWEIKQKLARWRWPALFDKLVESSLGPPPPYRIRVLVHDNGADYLSEHFLRVGALLGITFVEAGTRSPTDKPFVESAFRFIHTGFAMHLPGYVGPDVGNRGQDIEKGSLLTVYELAELFDLWVRAVYENTKHEGLTFPLFPGKTFTPNEMHRILQRFTPEAPVPFGPQTYIQAKRIQWQVIGTKGIRFAKRNYDCAELNEFRHVVSPYPGHGNKWPVHVDNDDWAQVWIRLPEIGWVTVPCTNLDILDDPLGKEMLQAILEAAPDELALSKEQEHQLMHAVGKATDKVIEKRRHDEARSRFAESQDPVPPTFKPAPFAVASSPETVGADFDLGAIEPEMVKYEEEIPWMLPPTKPIDD